MSNSNDFTTIVDLDDFEQDVSRVEDFSDRVRLSGYGLAAPLVEARAAQMKREVKRTARRKGADHPEVALRQANADRADERFALFGEELDRVRISRPEFDLDKGAAIWGRVVNDGVPQPKLSVSAIGDGVSLEFGCTDEVGSFALEVPANTVLRLSVRDKEGAELFRDTQSAQLEIGEQQYREIDLTRGAETPCPDPGPDLPPKETFKMLDLVGRNEAAALSLLANQSLKQGKRSTESVAGMEGLIISHTPEAGVTVKLGDIVDIVVGAAMQVQVPNLTGLTLQRGQALLKKAGLMEGKLSQISVEKERAGLIVNQAPLPGVLTDRDSAVDMTIGLSVDEVPDLVTVPDVIGNSVDEADASLKKANLKRVQGDEVPVPPNMVGLVAGQSPGPGAMVPPETIVALILGKPEVDGNWVSVPDLRGKKPDNAKAILEEAELTMGDVSEQSSNRVQAGTVIEQSPPPGSLAEPGKAVSLVIATRPITEVPRLRIPSVTGIPYDHAAAVLKETGFDMQRIERKINAPVQVNIVLAQTPDADSTAKAGTVVTLVVGIQMPKQPRPGLDRKVTRIAELAQSDLVKRRVLAADEPVGAFAQRLIKAGVGTSADIDKLLATNRRELRDKLGFRTLAQTDHVIRALKRAREQVGD